MTITDEQVEAVAKAIFAQTFRGGIDWDKCPNMHAEYVERSIAALTAAAQAGKAATQITEDDGTGDIISPGWTAPGAERPLTAEEERHVMAGLRTGTKLVETLPHEGERVEPPLPAAPVTASLSASRQGEPSPEPDNNLLHKIRAAQVNVGEQMVLDDLRRRGLLDSPVFECPECGKDIAEGAQPHDCRPPAQLVEGHAPTLLTYQERLIWLLGDLMNDVENFYGAANPKRLGHINCSAARIIDEVIDPSVATLTVALTEANQKITTLTKELAEARKVID